MSTIVTQTASNAAALNADILQADSISQHNTVVAYTIDLTGNITLGAALDAINLDPGSSLTIEGNGNTLDGNHAANGLFAYAGTVSVDDLTIADARAVGGPGGGSEGGGGGAGLGGGLFVASGAVVSLDGVVFTGDSATGGQGGGSSGVLAGGGGGLLGGAGGSYYGGGGGVGARGGTSHGSGGPGLVPGTKGGGGGGTSGGGGGGHGGGSGGGGGSGVSGGGGGGGGGVGGARGSSPSVGVGGAGGFGGGGGGQAVGGGGGVRRRRRVGGGRPAGAGGGGFGGGGGNGLYRGGGGGLGAGGDIFVQQGGELIVGGGSLGIGQVGAGAAGSHASPGDAFGTGLFIQGNQAVTLEGGTQPLIVAGTIADQDGAWFSLGKLTPDAGTSADGTTNAAVGTLVIGSGVVQLGTAGTENTFAGGIVVGGGATLAIAGDGDLGVMNAGNAALGQNAVTLTSGSALDFTAGFTLDHAIVVSGDPTFTIGAGTFVNDATLISDGTSAGNVVLTGGGTLELSNPGGNTYSGGTTIEGGSTLLLATIGSGGTGSFDIVSGTLVVQHLTTQTVSTDLGLSNAIREIDFVSQAFASEGTQASFTIDLANSITLGTADLANDLTGVVLGAGSTLTIDGGGFTLDGGGTHRGLFAYQGVLNVESLSVADARAIGGAGGRGRMPAAEVRASAAGCSSRPAPTSR